MTNAEFSNEFDVLYNSITSNQAPGLDEYEKSVFLTKAQDEIVKSYFNPRSNKTQKGFDGNEKRQIDFSMIMRSAVYGPSSPIEIISGSITEGLSSCKSYNDLINLYSEIGIMTDGDIAYINYYMTDFAFVIRDGNGEQEFASILPFGSSFFDMRDNTKSVILDGDILMFINEYVEAKRGESTARLTVLPINYIEYSRLMSKAYKRPLKNQAWRLLDNSDGHKKAEIVIGPNDTINRYVIRYVKRPRAIRLITFDDVTLDGRKEEQSCELDPILHPEILQRAVELAKAAYTGDLQSQVALGQSSQTDVGITQVSNRQ